MMLLPQPDSAAARRAHSVSLPGKPRRNQPGCPVNTRDQIRARGKSRLCGRGLAGVIEPKQRCAPDQRPALRLNEAVEPLGFTRQTRRGRVGPVAVAQRALSDGDGRARDRPWTCQRRKGGDIHIAAERKAQPDPGKPIKLSERTQDQQSWSSGLPRKRQFGRNIGKTFIDHKTADARRERQQLGAIVTPTVGIVGIDHDGKIGAGERGQIGDLGHVPARGAQDRPRIRYSSARQSAPVPAGDNRGSNWIAACAPASATIGARRAIGLASRVMQQLDVGPGGQRAPVPRLELRQRIGLPVDAGRQVDPVVQPPAEALQGQIEIAAVFQHPQSNHMKVRKARHPASTVIART